MAAIPSASFTSVTTPLSQKCLACFDPFEKEETVVDHGNLSHLFHERCLWKWVDAGSSASKDCPVCRLPIERINEISFTGNVKDTCEIDQLHHKIKSENQLRQMRVRQAVSQAIVQGDISTYSRLSPTLTPEHRGSMVCSLIYNQGSLQRAGCSRYEEFATVQRPREWAMRLLDSGSLSEYMSPGVQYSWVTCMGTAFFHDPESLHSIWERMQPEIARSNQSAFLELMINACKARQYKWLCEFTSRFVRAGAFNGIGLNLPRGHVVRVNTLISGAVKVGGVVFALFIARYLAQSTTT